MKTQQFVPSFTRWRHGGWYVLNVRHIGGGCGCVSNNYLDGKWRIVCDPRRGNLGEEGDFTFPTRDAAARAEHDLVQAVIMTEMSKWSELKDSRGYCQSVGENEVHIIKDHDGHFCVRIENEGKEVKVLDLTTGCFEQALGWAMNEVQALRNIGDKPKFYNCGICGWYHSASFDGDCRDDSERFTSLDLDLKYGSEGWEEVDMPV